MPWPLSSFTTSWMAFSSLSSAVSSQGFIYSAFPSPYTSASSCLYLSPLSKSDFIIYHFSAVLLISSPPTSCCHLTESAWPKPNCECSKVWLLNACTRLVYRCWRKISQRGELVPSCIAQWSQRGPLTSREPSALPQDLVFLHFLQLPHPILPKFLTLLFTLSFMELGLPFDLIKK